MFQLDKMLRQTYGKESHRSSVHTQGEWRSALLLFLSGNPLGVYDLEKHWRLMNISTMWEDTQYVIITCQEKLNLLPPPPCNALIRGFCGVYLFVERTGRGDSKKLGKNLWRNPEKKLAELPFFLVEGTKAALAGEGNAEHLRCPSRSSGKRSRLSEEMVIIVGRHWLNDRLRRVPQGQSDIIARLSLIEVFSELQG